MDLDYHANISFNFCWYLNFFANEKFQSKKGLFHSNKSSICVCSTISSHHDLHHPKFVFATCRWILSKCVSCRHFTMDMNNLYLKEIFTEKFHRIQRKTRFDFRLKRSSPLPLDYHHMQFQKIFKFSKSFWRSIIFRCSTSTLVLEWLSNIYLFFEYRLIRKNNLFYRIVAI